MPRDGITDEQILALGRFTWSAMKLETWMARICGYLIDGVTDKGTAGKWVENINKQLTDPDATQRRAIDWLNEAYEVLNETRNATLHGHLTAFYFGDAPAPDNIWEWQLMIANDRHGSFTPFTPAALGELQDRVEMIHDDGITVDVILAARTA